MVVKIPAAKYSGSKQFWLPRNLHPIQDGANNRVVTYSDANILIIHVCLTI